MKTETQPLISVIIPAFNCERTIEAAVTSILNQTYRNIEILVVDDGSSDETKKVAFGLAKRFSNVSVYESEVDPYRYDTRLKRNINAGYAARNLGLLHAKGEFITFQDADDASLLNRIEIQYRLLTKYKAHHISID